MADILTGAAVFILVVTGLGLFRVLRSQIAAERMMAVQLLGTGGAAAMLLLGVATASDSLADVALLLMLLSAFSCAAFTLGQSPPPSATERAEDKP
jgi:multicomponent Na+:H+ antiporter subunit F